MKSLKSIILFFLAIILFSCEKIIPFTGDVTQPKIVVNSLFQSDNFWEVHVSSSLSVIDTGSLSNIENASVLILDNQNNLVEVLSHDSLGFYKGTTIPQAGQQYKIEVSAPGYVSINAEDQLPESINISNVDTSSSSIGDNERMDISITFTDPINFSNYYRLEIEIGLIYEDDFGTMEYFEFPASMILEDPVFENYGGGPVTQGLFVDNSFNGEEKTIEIQIDNIIKEFDKADELEIDHIRLYLYNITEPTYLFSKSYQVYGNANGNPFAQPVQVFSNVTNGFGIFAGAQVNTYDIF